MNVFRRLAPFALGLLLGACEDNPAGPSDIELRLLASSFDALGRARFGDADGYGAGASHVAALALRAGVRPARVSIAVDGVSEEYWALQVEHAFRDDLTQRILQTLPIATRTMVAWRGSGPERVVSITVQGDTGAFWWPIIESLELRPGWPLPFGPPVGLMFERGAPAFHAVEGGGRSTRQTIGAECPVPRRDPIMQVVAPVLPPARCHQAEFFTRFKMRVVEGPASGGVAADARVVEMNGQDVPVPGVRLQYSPPVPCPVCR